MVICCAVFLLLMFATGDSGVFGLSRLGAILKELNSGGMASFQALSEIRAAHMDVWFQLRRIELAQNGEEVATSIGTIRSDEERLVAGDFTDCLLQFEERHGRNATDSLCCCSSS
jgi:hypothetical protein